MEPLTNFTLFSNLPAELRNRTWIHTVDWRSHVLPRPPINELAVCHEARGMLLQIYRPCFLSSPRPVLDDIGFCVSSSPGERWVQIEGMGSRSPRSPYANYETDVLYMNWAIWHGIREGKSLEEFLCQEAIENLQHVVILLNAWAPIILGGPIRLVGVAPPPPKPDARWVLTSFGALKTLSLVEKPKMRVGITPLDDDELGRQKDTGRIGGPDDDVLKRVKLALRSRFAEGKILIPVDDPANFVNPYFKLDEPQEWVDRRRRELPGWSAPEVQYAMIIPDPYG